MARHKKKRNLLKPIAALVLAGMMLMPGVGTLSVQAAETIREQPRNVDMSLPEELEDTLADDENSSANSEQFDVADGISSEKEADLDAGGSTDVGRTKTADDITDGSISEDNVAELLEDNAEEMSGDGSNEEAAGEIDLQEPEDLYPLDAEPEGTLVDYDETYRTYKTGDQEYTTVFGGYVGTYKDDSGEVQLADDTLTETGDVLTNTANDYSVELPLEMEEDEGVSVTDVTYPVEFIPLDGDYSHPVAKDNAVLYNQVLPDVDVQYTVLDKSIKEDIILEEPIEQTGFSYELVIPGLEAEVYENQLYLYPEGKTREESVYLLEAPSMEDAAEEISFNITMSLLEEEGKKVLTITPDADWLNAPERSYPVRIDPTTVNIGRQDFSLIGVEQGSPNSTIGDNNYPYVGYDDGIKSCNWEDYGTWHQMCRTYVKIWTDFSAIPEGSKIDSAVFSVSQRTHFSDGESEFGLYRVDESWEDTITWNTQPSGHTFIDVQYAAADKNTYIDFDVKDLANDWIQGLSANNGLVLKATDETGMQCEVLNNKNSAYGPKMTVVWSDAEDPFLRDLPLDGTTVNLRPMTEKDTTGKQEFDAVFADGLAKSHSIVSWYLSPDQTVDEAQTTEAEGLYAYPDSTAYNQVYPNATKYLSKDSNWQGALITGLETDKLYRVQASATKDGETGKEVSSDSFLIYQVKRFDTLPKIARYYGVPLKTLMKDNRVQDTLLAAGNTLFIRNPKTNIPYNPGTLTDLDKMRIDGALLGRGLHCEFGFEPVNLNTGNFCMDLADASLEDLGGTFTIGRSYNSRGYGLPGSFGVNWTFAYDQTLSLAEDGSILYAAEDGSILFFDRQEDGSFTAPAGYVYRLEQIKTPEPEPDDQSQAGETDDSNSEDYAEVYWELTDADQTVYGFDRFGILRTVTDKKDHKTTLDYDEDYTLKSVMTPSGKVFSITQDEQGRITRIGLPDGNTLSYAYDDAGDLVSFTDANGGISTYTYDASHRMLSWDDPNGNTVVTNTYDKDGRVTEQKDANGDTAVFRYSDSRTVTTDNEGHETSYDYDAQFRTTAITYPDATRKLVFYNAENQVDYEVTSKGTVRYSYDALGNIISQTREDGLTATWSYDTAGNLTGMTDYDGAVTSYTYNDANDLTGAILPDGSTRGYSYDALHRCVSETDGNGATRSYSYNGAVPLSMTDGEGGTWSFSYDGMNRLVSVTDPGGRMTKTTYDGLGNTIKQTDGNGDTTIYTLDGAGNVLSETDPNGNVTSYSYDPVYNLVKMTDAAGNDSTFTYDGNGNRISMTGLDGNKTTYTYDDMGRLLTETGNDFGTHSYQYDTAGNMISKTDGEGGVTSFEYNVMGLVTKVTDPNGKETTFSYDANGNETSCTDAEGGISSVSYDAMGRVTEETDELGAQKNYAYDGNGNVVSITYGDGRIWSYAYDNNGQLVSETDPADNVSTYTYDGSGNRVSYTDSLGNTTTYGYDGVGRVTEETNALGEKKGYAYDANGNLTVLTDAKGGKLSYTYSPLDEVISEKDSEGHLTKLSYDANSNMTQATDALKGTLSYTYDSQGNALTVTDLLGTTYTYTYDKNGNPLSYGNKKGGTIRMTYDAAGLLKELEDPMGLKVSYAYDGADRLTKEADNTGNETSYTYDAAGNVTGKTDTLGRTTIYTYDTYGRLLKVTEPDGSVTAYTYDALDRVSSMTDAEGTTTTYTYDAVGNLTAMTEADGSVTSYAYDAAGRVTSVTDANGNTESYGYDGNGNVISLTDANGITCTYTYDKNDNLITATDGKEGTTKYAYDALNRMISETSPLDEVREYRYDAADNLIKYQDPNGLVTEYIYDDLGNLSKEISPRGSKTTYEYDLHGNVTSIKDPNGNVTTYTMDLNDRVTAETLPNKGVYSYVYDAAGRLTDITTPLGFTDTFVYDTADNIIKETNSLGQSTVYTYDKLHRMLSMTDAAGETTSYTYDIRDNQTSETDPLGRTWTYQYDPVGNLTGILNPKEQMTALSYDPVGNITSLTKPGDRTTAFTYDANNNLVAQTDPMGNVTSYAYDADDRLTSETDALGKKTRYAYDASGRLTEVTDKLGVKTGYAYDADSNITDITGAYGLVTQFNYDANGNLTSVKDPAGNTTSYSYDDMDQLVRAVSAEGKTTSYTYDLEGNLTSRKDASGRKEQFTYDEAGKLTGYTSPAGNRTSYDYDKLNQLVKKSYENTAGKKTDADVIYGYNAAGERVAMTDGIGEASYAYDELGRIINVTDSAGKEVSYTYDEAGNISGITYPDGTEVSYTYDLNGNITSITDKDGVVTQYRYDALNRLIGTIRPNGIVSDISYDAMDHVTGITIRCGECGEILSTYTYTYDEQGFLVKETAEESLAGYTYDDKHDGKHTDGKHDSLYPHGNKHNGKHDKDGDNAIRIVTTERSYTYDENGALSSCIENEENKGTTEYHYEYDKDGNRTAYYKTENGTLAKRIEYKYNKANQLIQETDKTDARINKQVKTTYEYDEDGNRISRSTKKQDAVTYEYDAENRLKAVTTSKEVLMAALYDGDGNLLFVMDFSGKGNGNSSDSNSSSNNGNGGGNSSGNGNGKGKGNGGAIIPETTAATEEDDPIEYLNSLIPKKNQESYYTITEYVNDINQENAEVLSELDPAGNVNVSYTYGPERTSKTDSTETSYYLYDGRDSVAGITDSTGVLTDSFRYDPYGEVEFGTPETINYYGYNAESANTNTGFQYLRARYYEAATGTFATEDTEPGNREEPLSQNRYAYVLNNPVNYADPTGHRRTLRSAVRNITKKAGSYVKKAVSSVASVVRTKARAVQSAADKVRSSIAQFTKRTSATLSKMIRPLGSNQSSSLKNARSAYRIPIGNTISARTAAAMASSNTAQNRTKVRGCGKAQKIKTTVTNFGNNVKTGWQNMSTDQKVTFCIAIALGVGITVMTFGAAAPVVGTGIAFMAAGAAGVGFSAGFYDMASYENPTTVERDTAMGAATGASIAGDILMVGGVAKGINVLRNATTKKTIVSMEEVSLRGYYKDVSGRWHRPNGEYASNAELGIESARKNTTGVHGNSLQNTMTNYGYVLVDKDTNEILKFGETLYPASRYSKSYITTHNAKMIILDQGSKSDIHYWQIDLNNYYKYKYGQYPPMNINGK